MYFINFILISILLTILKVSGNIDWSWWWVLAPVWVPIVTPIVVFLGTLIYYGFKDLKNKLWP